MSSSDNLCKQFGPRSAQQNVGPDLKEIYVKVDFEKNQQHNKLPDVQTKLVYKINRCLNIRIFVTLPGLMLSFHLCFFLENNRPEKMKILTT